MTHEIFGFAVRESYIVGLFALASVATFGWVSYYFEGKQLQQERQAFYAQYPFLRNIPSSSEYGKFLVMTVHDAASNRYIATAIEMHDVSACGSAPDAAQRQLLERIRSLGDHDLIKEPKTIVGFEQLEIPARQMM
jgi:hypothetical protein